jgi:Leucine-rich repeat (LRR) protein
VIDRRLSQLIDELNQTKSASSFSVFFVARQNTAISARPATLFVSNPSGLGGQIWI